MRRGIERIIIMSDEGVVFTNGTLLVCAGGVTYAMTGHWIAWPMLATGLAFWAVLIVVETKLQK